MIDRYILIPDILIYGWTDTDCFQTHSFMDGEMDRHRLILDTLSDGWRDGQTQTVFSHMYLLMERWKDTN